MTVEALGHRGVSRMQVEPGLVRRRSQEILFEPAWLGMEYYGRKPEKPDIHTGNACHFE
jgi:hypothetical protein